MLALWDFNIGGCVARKASIDFDVGTVRSRGDGKLRGGRNSSRSRGRRGRSRLCIRLACALQLAAVFLVAVMPNVEPPTPSVDAELKLLPGRKLPRLKC